MNAEGKVPKRAWRAPRAALVSALALAALVVVGAQAGVRAQSATPPESVGAAAPDFTALDAEGRVVRLSDYEGRVRLVTLIAPGISLCDLQAQALNDLYLTHRREGLVVLAVSTYQDAGYLRSYRQEQSLEYPVLLGTPAFDAAYGLPACLPTTFLIGREGAVLKRYEGYTDGWVMAADVQAPLGEPWRVEPGARAPVFGVYDIHGEKVRLDQFAGAWVVLVFLPTLAEPGSYGLAKNLSEKAFLAGQGRVAMVVFSLDAAEEAAMAVEGMELPPRVVSDPWQVIFGVFGATDPDSGKARAGVVVVDPNGLIHTALYDAEARDAERVVGLIASLTASSSQETEAP